MVAHALSTPSCARPLDRDHVGGRDDGYRGVRWRTYLREGHLSRRSICHAEAVDSG
jgi:hypothetical protein